MSKYIIYILFIVNINCISNNNSGESQIGNTGAYLRVLNVIDNLVVGLQEYIGPNKGYKFIGIEIIIDNRNSKYSIDSFSDFLLLQDEKGYIYTPHIGIRIAPELQPSLKMVELNPGDFVRGWVGYLIPIETDVNTLRMRYASHEYKSAWLNISS